MHGSSSATPRYSSCWRGAHEYASEHRNFASLIERVQPLLQQSALLINRPNALDFPYNHYEPFLRLDKL